jgi:hypothetical protein
MTQFGSRMLRTSNWNLSEGKDLIMRVKYNSYGNDVIRISRSVTYIFPSS